MYVAAPDNCHKLSATSLVLEREEVAAETMLLLQGLASLLIKSGKEPRASDK